MIMLRRVLTALAIVGLSPAAWARCEGAPTTPGAFAAQIVSVSGRGETRPPDQEIWTPATLAQSLVSGAAVRTLAQSSAAVLLADRTQIRMSALSQLFLCDAQPTQTWLELGVGRLWARSKKVPAALTLQTPAAVAGIRGTDWDVEVDAAGRTTLTVLSGRIDLSNAWGRVELGPSEQGFAEPGKAPVKRLIVNPRERVQWVMANPVDVRRWAEFQDANGAGLLAALQAELQSGDWAAARALLAAMSSQPDRAAVAELMMADMEVFDGLLEPAQRRLEHAWQRTQDPRTAARRTELLLALDRAAEARTWLDATRAVAPDASALLLADADWQRLAGHGEAALALYRRALARATENTQRAAAWAGLGRALQERGDLSAARDALAQAVLLVPNNASYLGAQATVAAEALRLTQAQQGFDQALALAGDDYVSLAGAGLLALQQGQAPVARELLLKALMIEPAYARAQVWLAVAEYTLGERSAALDSIDRARLADPKDPLPWQIQSMLYNDIGEPAQAMASAREALTRLPYLKSLNPLASDSQGSANLGKALGDIGLEHWARAYASASYYPLWAGSHFFLADRFESDFNRKSELIQGYLSDPTVFGASDKRAPLLLTTGSEWAATASAEHNALRHNTTFDLDHRGFAAVPLPVSWLLRFNDVQTWPHDGSPTTRYRLSAPGVDVALGLRPSERLALFGLHSDSILNYRFPDGLDFGNGITFSSDAQTHTQRSDLGASWRWSADSQTWLKLHSDKNQTALDLDDQVWGPRYYRFSSDEQGLFLRHTLMHGDYRLSLGWERVEHDSTNVLSNAWTTSPRVNQEQYNMPWLAAEWRGVAWSVMAEAYWPSFSTGQVGRYTDTSGGDLFAPEYDSAELSRRALTRVGLSHRFGPGRALHFAYQESLRGSGTHTLAPVATGAIAVDNQYQLAGSLARKTAVQLDWEVNASTFLGASVSAQNIVNPVMQNGRLFAQNSRALFDRIGAIAPVLLNAQTGLNTYEDSPYFGQGDLAQGSVAVNHMLSPNWSVLGSYTYTHSVNTTEAFAGQLLPGFAPHVWLAQTTWRHGSRGFSLARLTWRSTRFSDEANFAERAPGWQLALASSWESTDRRWRVTGSIQAGLQTAEPPTLWVLLRYRP